MEPSALDLTTIERNGNKPEEWLTFINKTKRESTNYNHVHRLYAKAASLISPDENRKNISYARLLVEFAKLQGMFSPDDARDTFRVARCNVKTFAIVHVAWAQFELSQGNRGKCKSLLKKGKMNGAEPLDIFNQALHSCEQGNERLLDDETEELAFTGVLLNMESGRTRVKLMIPTLQSDSELTQEKMITGDNTTENEVEFSNIQGSQCSESLAPPKFDTSGVISFKLFDNVDRPHPRIRQKLSSSSSSGEETITAPLHHICRPINKSMSTCKPLSRPTPDSKTVESRSLSNSMNLSVRKPLARRGLRNNSLFLGPPVRGTCKVSLEDVKERNTESEDMDNMDDIKALDDTSQLLIQDKVVCENVNDPAASNASILTSKNNYSQENVEAKEPDIRSINSENQNVQTNNFTHHEDVIMSTVYTDIISDTANKELSQNGPNLCKERITPLYQDPHGRQDQAKNNVRKTHNKQGYHVQKIPKNQGYPHHGIASDQGYHSQELPKKHGYPDQELPKNVGYPGQGIASSWGYHDQEMHNNQEYPDHRKSSNNDYPNKGITSNKGCHNQEVFKNQRFSGHGIASTSNREYPNKEIHGNRGYPNKEIHGNQGYPNNEIHGNRGYPNKGMHCNKRHPNEFASDVKQFGKRGVSVNPIFPNTLAATGNPTMFVNGKSYLQLGTIGRGGSSKVFRAFDGKHVCAVKYVSLEDADDLIVQSYINEITMLKRLQGSDHIIRLYDWEQMKEENSIVLVLECGSIDLAAFLRKNRSTFTQTELTAYWKQMLEAVNVIHNQGIIHSDLKPANFLFVEGRLKLIDFGIANAIQADQTSIQRDTQVGTLNFMSPEAFQDISGSSQIDPKTGRSRPCTKIGRPSDVWSLGCILYNMVYGRTPFQHITNQAMKLQCIMDENYAIEYPPIGNQQLLDVLKACLVRNPRERYTIPQLLMHPFLSSGKQAEPNEEQLFNCLLELAQAQVNSPCSIRVASKSICEQLRSGNKIDLSSVLAKKRHLQQSMALRAPLEDLGVQEIPQSLVDPVKALSSSSAPYMGNTLRYSNKENV